MPLYEFECTACHHQFEELVSASKTVEECPRCHKPQVKKKVSAGAFKTSGGFSSLSSSSSPSCSSSGG